MPNLLLESIKEVICESLNDKAILVWYDNEGTLMDVIPKSIQPGIEFIQYDGSYLKIRSIIEKNDPQLEKKWVIYVPEMELERSWILDYEVLGTKVTMGLERLLVEKIGIVSNSRLKELLKGQAGRDLSLNWEELMSGKNVINTDDIIKALLGIIFGLGSVFNITRAVLEYVSSPEKYSQELSKYSLHALFSELINCELGLEVKSEPAVSAEDLAAAILFSELVVRSRGVGKVEFERLLPREDKRSLWVEMLDDWQENDRLRGAFLEWSTTLETKYEVLKKISGFENLIEVNSFKCVDQILLDEICLRITHTENGFEDNLELGVRVSQIRSELIWSKFGGTTYWNTIRSALELYRHCVEARIELDQSPPKNIDEFNVAYTKELGWWNIDKLHLELSRSTDGITESIFSLFVKPASNEYFKWITISNFRFSNAASKIVKWECSTAFNQSYFWNSVVGSSEPGTAVFFIDALRFDLCKILQKDLLRKGYEVNLQNMLSSLPSVTEIGMSAMLPDAENNLSVNVQDSKMLVSLRENRITGKNDRTKWLGATLGQELKILDLSEINKADQQSLKNMIKQHKRIVVMDREIDRSGTFLSGISIDLFSKLVSSLSECITRLHEAEVERIIITTDHGFLLMPQGHKFESILVTNVPKDSEKNRRYIIGRPPNIQGFVRFSLKALDIVGEGDAIFPYGITTVAIQGETGQFIHGGLSLQENSLGVLISSSKKVPRKVQVKASIPNMITSAIFIIELIPIIDEGRKNPRKVFVQIKSGVDVISRSDVITLEVIPRKVNLVLKKITDLVDVEIIDADSKELLIHSKKIKVQLAGYEELI